MPLWVPLYTQPQHPCDKHTYAQLTIIKKLSRSQRDCLVVKSTFCSFTGSRFVTAPTWLFTTIYNSSFRNPMTFSGLCGHWTSGTYTHAGKTPTYIKISLSEIECAFNASIQEVGAGRSLWVPCQLGLHRAVKATIVRPGLKTKSQNQNQTHRQQQQPPPPKKPNTNKTKYN